MKNSIRLITIFATISLSGCATNYQYLSRGAVTTTSGEQREAVMYWNKDEGRLWYGKKYVQMDSDLNVRVCGQMPNIFSLASDGIYELPGRAGDNRVADVDTTGQLKLRQEPTPLADDGRCGVILINGIPAGSSRLDEGVSPVMSVLCNNVSRPDRYPAVMNYQFGVVTRQEHSDQTLAPDACNDPAGE